MAVATPSADTAVTRAAAPKADQSASKAVVKKKPKKKKAAQAKPLTPEEQKAAAKAKAEQEKKLAKEKAKAEREKKLAAEKAAREKKAAEAKLAKEKAEKERQAAKEKAKAERDKKLAADKAAREKKVAEAKAAKEKAEEERKLARAKAAEERRLAAEAKAKAIEDKRLAKLKAEEERKLAAARAAEEARQAEVSRLMAMEVVKVGNNGELRSEAAPAPANNGLFASLFGGPVVKQSMLPETRALDAALEQKQAKSKFKVNPIYEPQRVSFSGYSAGTIVVDTANHFLYLVESSSSARRYGIAVGKDGLQYKGSVTVGDKQEWPRWIPTKEMQAREPKKYGQYADGMPGGGQNPLGARAIYLYEGRKDTHLRIHGTIAPETIGTDSSNGCFRMINDHVIDLYNRVKVGTQVVVL